MLLAQFKQAVYIEKSLKKKQNSSRHIFTFIMILCNLRIILKENAAFHSHY